jgi:alpha-L-fucosidase
MKPYRVSRRDMLLSAGVSLLSMGANGLAQIPPPLPVARISGGRDPMPGPPTEDQIRRLGWWRAARFGMFIHYGLFSQHARQEWAMEKEAIPVVEYQKLAEQFDPRPGFAREWARLAKAAGMKYMVMTTKHHEGFCNFDTKLTDYNAAKQGPKRDLVREYVEAARAEGMRVGLYYSLMDWHHPDGARCATDEAGRKRFVEYTHGLVRELLTNYGQIDILWYDGSFPLSAAGWESERLNKMMFELQPDILVNNRNLLPGDFSTPEQRIAASGNGAAWESCMTLNESWGYDSADDEWKSSRSIVRNLISCARDGGNYLLNIGPRGDGSVPEESIRVLREVGRWLSANGETIYKAEPCQVRRSAYGNFTRIGNTLFMHIYFWPGGDVALSGLRTKVKTARFFRSNEEIKFSQSEYRVHLVGLPIEAPDSPVTTIALECESEPTEDSDAELRFEKPRVGVGVEA